MFYLLQQNRIAAGFGGFLKQFHTRLRRRASSFFRITPMAGADDIFPIHAPSVGAGNDVVQAELLQAEFFPAVLAAIAVSDKDITPIEFDRIVGNPVIVEQANNTGDLDFKVDRENPVFQFRAFIEFRSQPTDFNPGAEVIVHEGAIFNADDFRNVFTEQAKRTFG